MPHCCVSDRVGSPCRAHTTAARANVPPGIPQLRAPPWSRHGWTKDSPGFLFYFQAHHARGPRLLHGEDTYRTVSVEADGATAAKAVHCFAHRSVSTAPVAPVAPVAFEYQCACPLHRSAVAAMD